MTLTIGRFGVDVTTNGPSAFSLSGDQLRISGPMRVSSVADMKTLRQQLSGYIDNPWEPVVPVTWTTDTSVNGYYTVDDVTIDVPTFGYKNGFASFDATLTRVRGYGGPVTESVCTGTARAGKPGGVTASTWHAVPSAAYAFNAATPGTISATRTGPGGNIYPRTHATAYYSARPTFIMPTANWYDMAATIKSSGSVMVGRQFDPSYTSWELSNGLVKMTTSSARSPSWNLYAPIYATPASWGTAVQIQPAKMTGGPTVLSAISVDQPTLTVLRNAPEECIIRLTYGSGGAVVPVIVDLGLRRGSRFFTVTMNSLTSDAWALSGGTNMNVALAAGGGYRNSAADADGNRLVMCSGQTPTTPASLAGIALNASGTFFDAMVGHEVGGGSAAAPDRATDMRDQFMAAITETQRVRLQ